MNAAPVETQLWSRRKWIVTIGAVLAIQTLLILALENRSPITPRKIVSAPLIHLGQHVSLWPLALNDPTLFVLPHREAFSGGAWLNHFPSLNYQPSPWTEPPRLLALSPESLGANFKEFIAANPSPQFQNIPTIEPPETIATVFPTPVSPAQSLVRLAGELATRRLLTPPQLQPQQSSDVLTNTIVQLLVDARGNTISAALLQSCGLADADNRAMQLAKSARFAPEPNALTLGTMIFQWATLPPAITNSPSEIP
jgi:hypothetical protein